MEVKLLHKSKASKVKFDFRLAPLLCVSEGYCALSRGLGLGDGGPIPIPDSQSRIQLFFKKNKFFKKLEKLKKKWEVSKKKVSVSAAVRCARMDALELLAVTSFIIISNRIITVVCNLRRHQSRVSLCVLNFCGAVCNKLL